MDQPTNSTASTQMDRRQMLTGIGLAAGALFVLPLVTGTGLSTALAATAAQGGGTPPPAGPQELILNGGFEDHGTSWVLTGSAEVLPADSHTGTFSCHFGDVNNDDGRGIQFVTLPAGPGTATLSFWTRKDTSDRIQYDQQGAYITDATGTIVQTLFRTCENAGWTQFTTDMTPYLGRKVGIMFLMHTDSSVLTSMVVDDVSLLFTPSPVDKDQCKDGGWKNYTDGTASFKNEGDCVSFAATGGKNAA
ncbi:MAG: hypothetical protein JWN17_1022 [Frankiales bacterium]|nr:hypothetical protein [Frankiales bacterium]